ncbi:hypothetical protein DSM104299_00425 [Baekduia alba]|uniref:hypothetical protein n=1 Tax=Baekduia alba TaxID=2997333 RepID=UPI0023417D76|nr:hypothetical protein [Baekduia alba]WCB91749.1 hypothetical protein DSM104299_00425 [Baekduia alba]
MDFSHALAAIQGWIGIAVSVSCVAEGVEYVRATGVLDTPELLATDEGEYWIFPLVGDVGAFSLSQAVFRDARWSRDGVRLRIALEAAALDVELA